MGFSKKFRSLLNALPAAANNQPPPMPNRTAHEQNKREAFDGMRAYHQSEIAHKKDAIDILKTILTSSLSLFTGLLATVFVAKIDTTYILYVSWIVTALVGVAAWNIVHSTNRKIDQDHARYQKYAQEYTLERRIIGLEDDLEKQGHTSAWVAVTQGGKSGYHHTKNILTGLGWIVFMVAFVASVIINGAILVPKNEVKAEQKAGI